MSGPREKGQVNSDTKKIRTYRSLILYYYFRNKAGENYLACHRQCSVRFMIPYTNLDTVVAVGFECSASDVSGHENELGSAVK